MKTAKLSNSSTGYKAIFSIALYLNFSYSFVNFKHFILNVFILLSQISDHFIHQRSSKRFTSAVYYSTGVTILQVFSSFLRCLAVIIECLLQSHLFSFF